MKITLTLTELTALVISSYRLPTNTTLDVDMSGIAINPDYICLHNVLKKNGCFDETESSILFHKKIESIKLLRNVYSKCRPDGFNYCSLVNAKYAIEEWEKFSTLVKRLGFPSMLDAQNPPWR